MFDINLKDIKEEKYMYYLILLFSIFFLIVIILICFFKGNMVRTKITEMVPKEEYIGNNKIYEVSYYYKVNGKLYLYKNTESNLNNKKYLYYDKNSPHLCSLDYVKDYSILYGLIIPFFGLLIAFINLQKINKKIKKFKYLN